MIILIGLSKPNASQQEYRDRDNHHLQEGPAGPADVHFETSTKWYATEERKKYEGLSTE